MSRKINNFLKLNYLNQLNSNISDTLLHNGFWTIENLEEGNQPDFISIEGNKILFKTCFHNDCVEEIVISENDLRYINYNKQKLNEQKRYLFTPFGDIGKKNLFFLNKEIEFFRKEGC